MNENGIKILANSGGQRPLKVMVSRAFESSRSSSQQSNSRLILDKVLMLGSRAETIIGRPVLPEAAVHAVVEEHQYPGFKEVQMIESKPDDLLEDWCPTYYGPQEIEQVDPVEPIPI